MALEFPSAPLPDLLKGWGSHRVGDDYEITRLGKVLVTIPGPADPTDKKARHEIEQMVMAMTDGPNLLIVFEHMVNELQAGLQPDLERAHGAISRVRFPAFMIDDSRD